MIYVILTLKTPNDGNGHVSFAVSKETMIENAVKRIVDQCSEFYQGKVEILDIKKQYDVNIENISKGSDTIN